VAEFVEHYHLERETPDNDQTAIAQGIRTWDVGREDGRDDRVGYFAGSGSARQPSTSAQ
jgi:hypothetical protein